ncbi:TraB/GumN family protein [Sphingomicrobium sediminis]|uniref:TraB/GumN family protein n=1 Tax=Sphingomicrobium sediminis TaxID=2950949 RepID=A0A9X2EI21_9SPHN|nr:TraB/GumN family protein [Sphingomicrobium sediminis]MCM8557131.1 TraB/GumN family protein [Sphingomicrobium sediminis]
MRIPSSLLGIAASFSLAAPAFAQDEAPVVPPPIIVNTAPPVNVYQDEASEEADFNGPALWKLADEDTTIYLFGTIHVLPWGQQWRTDLIDEKIAESDALVIETLVPENPFHMLGAMAEIAYDPTLPKLKDRIDPKLHEALDALIAKGELPAPFYDGLENWAVAMFLAENVEEIERGPGAEDSLQRSFKNMGKRIGQLETFTFQIGIFDRLDPEYQELWLQGVIEASMVEEAEESAQDEFQTMVDTWIAGESLDLTVEMEEYQVEETIEASEEEIALMEGFNAQFLEYLLFERNRNWVDWLERRLDRPGTVFVAVGAGHMWGEKSVPDYLAAAGYTLERLQ